MRVFAERLSDDRTLEAHPPSALYEKTGVDGENTSIDQTKNENASLTCLNEIHLSPFPMRTSLLRRSLNMQNVSRCNSIMFLNNFKPSLPICFSSCFLNGFIHTSADGLNWYLSYPKNRASHPLYKEEQDHIRSKRCSHNSLYSSNFQSLLVCCCVAPSTNGAGLLWYLS